MAYVIQDLLGASSGTGYIYITVNSVPDAPIALDDSYAVDEDTVLQHDSTTGVLVNDFDSDGDPLTLQLVSGTSHGSLVLNADGSFTYTPDANWYGVDSFVYEISDGTFTDTATVTITVNSVNDAPVAIDDYVTTDEDTPVIIDIMKNDYDIDGDPFSVLLVAWGDIHGTWEFVDIPMTAGGTRKGIKYTPNANWYGSVSMAYVIQDLLGASSGTGYIYITVERCTCGCRRFLQK
jgi:VCBS repeat-containing protein